AVYRLQHKLQIEGGFQLRDDDDRLAFACQRHQIAAADLALAGVAEAFEEGFHRGVEGRLPHLKYSESLAASLLLNRSCLIALARTRALISAAALARRGENPQKIWPRRTEIRRHAGDARRYRFEVRHRQSFRASQLSFVLRILHGLVARRTDHLAGDRRLPGRIAKDL